MILSPLTLVTPILELTMVEETGNDGSVGLGTQEHVVNNPVCFTVPLSQGIFARSTSTIILDEF